MPEFKTGSHGSHGLVQSFIPTNKGILRQLKIDKETDLQISVLALKNGLHVGELYRRIVWHYMYCSDVKPSDLCLKPSDDD